MDFDIENYKVFLKPYHKNDPTHIFPFKQLLEKYAHLMNMIMKFFTCEGRFSRLYQYHIRLLMHFTTIKPLNLAHYLYKSLVKMTEKVQRKGKITRKTFFIMVWSRLLFFISFHRLICHGRHSCNQMPLCLLVVNLLIITLLQHH